MLDRLAGSRNDTARAGATLLLLPLLFVAHMTATYNLGISYPLQSLLTSGFESNDFGVAGPLLLLGAPLVAIALNLLSVLRLEVRRERGDLVSTLRLRPSFANLAIIAGAVALYAMFALYLAAENWSCLTGAQATC